MSSPPMRNKMTSGSLRLDEIGGVIRRAEWNEIAADSRSAQRGRGSDEPRFQRVAERIVEREVVELLSIGFDQRGGDCVRLHLRGAADAKHVPMATRPGHGVSVAAGDNVEDSLLVGNLGYRERKRRVRVSQKK